MALIIWFIVWLCCGLPSVEPWNGWLISLLVLVALTVAVRK